MASGCYVYGITARETPLPTGLTGFGGAALVAVPWRALAAVASSLDPAELRSTPDNLLRHEAVVEALCRMSPTLPVRFGTVLAGPEAVARALAERYEALVADLARIGDKVELGLTVLWEQDALPDEPADATGNMPIAAAASGRGTRYLQARLAAHRRETALQGRARAIAEELDTALRSQTIAMRRAILPTPRLVVRAAYLLEPAQVGAFQETFEAIRQAHVDLRFLLSGPWPPYSFVTM